MPYLLHFGILQTAVFYCWYSVGRHTGTMSTTGTHYAYPWRDGQTKLTSAFRRSSIQILIRPGIQ